MEQMVRFVCKNKTKKKKPLNSRLHQRFLNDNMLFVIGNYGDCKSLLGW